MSRLRFFGHAAVALIADGGESLLVDPYASGGLDGKIGYEPIPLQPDYVVCSHQHDDHSAVGELGGEPRLVDQGSAGPFHIRRFPYSHDEYDGARFGGRVDALRVDFDGLSVVHASDLGQSPHGPTPDALRGCEFALLPVGGLYTAGGAQAWEWSRRLGAEICVPIHAASPSCRLPLHSVSNFSSYFQSVHQPGGSVIEADSSLRSFAGGVVVLRAECESRPHVRMP